MATGRHKLGFSTLRAAVAPATFSAVPIPKAAIATLLPLPHLEDKQTLLQSFPKITLFPSFARLSCVAPLVLLCPQALHALPTIHLRLVHRSPSTSFLRPPHKQKKCGPAALRREPAHQKSVDFSLKKAHVGTPGLHALASAARTYSLTARIHYHPFSFLLFYKGKEKRKQKQIQQVRIHRSDSLRSSSRCTRLARRASSAEIYVAIATRFVRDCVEDLDLLTA